MSHSPARAQIKRRRHLPAATFHARDALPPVVPQGERWASCISNRTFKSKVCPSLLLGCPRV